MPLEGFHKGSTCFVHQGREDGFVQSSILFLEGLCKGFACKLQGLRIEAFMLF